MNEITDHAPDDDEDRGGVVCDCSARHLMDVTDFADASRRRVHWLCVACGAVHWHPAAEEHADRPETR